MEFKLTASSQRRHHDKDGKDRNYIYYYINDILILKQKYPYDENYDRGYDIQIDIYDEYILNGKMYQTRFQDGKDKEPRLVYFPLSKKKLESLGVPKDLKIEIDK